MILHRKIFAIIRHNENPSSEHFYKFIGRKEVILSFMAIRYRIKIVNSPNGCIVRQNPASNGISIGTLRNGDDVIVNNSKVAPDGSTWFQVEGSQGWILYRSKNQITSVKIMQDLKNTIPSSDSPLEMPDYSYPGNNSSSVNAENNRETNSRNQGYTMYSPSTYRPLGADNMGADILQQNAYNYPPVVTTNTRGEKEYDFYTVVDKSMMDAVSQIKKNLNVPTAYDKLEISNLNNTAFNRYNIVYPDSLSYGLKGVVFFTRPDIWVTDNKGEFIDQVLNDPQLYYLSRTNGEVLKQLTLGYTGKHEFIPLLCNKCRSLDVGDETLETTDIGETFIGYKMAYARHSVRSMTGSTFSCKFEETYDLSLTYLFQAWCSYESSVYIGSMLPKTEYIGDKILDYACDVYLFLVDRTNTIRFWTKYFGVFPTNVSKSVYSYDEGNNIHLPEQNITFSYFDRRDLDPDSLIQFNRHSKLPLIYLPEYDPSLGHGVPTWSGPPFVELVQEPNGVNSKADVFKLRYRTMTT